MLSYEHQINDMLTLYPSALLKTADQTRQLDINANLKIKDQIWVGAYIDKIWSFNFCRN